MPNAAVSEIVARLRAAPARAGSTRVLLIDGPAGSGKTTLANRIVVALGGTASAGPGTFDPSAPVPPGPQVLHGDDMYEGWSGLGTVWSVLGERILEPLARREDAAFEMWDWDAHRRTHTIPVPQAPVLVIEGVGVAQRAAREFASVVVFVDAPWDVRLERGLARDGEDARPHWETWHPQEDVHLAEQGTRAAADVVIDGTAPVPD